MILAVKWFLRLLRDAVMAGIVNRSPLQSLVVVFLILLGLVIVASQASAPFIYTLF